MSMVKRMMEAQEDLRQHALDILVETELLEQCDYHPGTYFDGGGGDLQDAYKLANSKVSRGEIELPGNMSRRDFTDVIKETYQDNSGVDSCQSCEKIFSKD
jgi:hypothetical protein